MKSLLTRLFEALSKPWLHRSIQSLERGFGYDATYLHEIVDRWPAAALRFQALPLLSQMRGPEAPLWAGAALASALDGDCGPCAQLTVDMALATGVPPELLRACLRRDFDAAGSAGLGFRFAEAAIQDTPEAEPLRMEIIETYGSKALIAAAYASATARAYPVIKRAMGHGSACQTLRIGDRSEPIMRIAA